jgi:hypothetical protein
VCYTVGVALGCAGDAVIIRFLSKH